MPQRHIAVAHYLNADNYLINVAVNIICDDYEFYCLFVRKQCFDYADEFNDMIFLETDEEYKFDGLSTGNGYKTAKYEIDIRSDVSICKKKMLAETSETTVDNENILLDCSPKV